VPKRSSSSIDIDAGAREVGSPGKNALERPVQPDAPPAASCQRANPPRGIRRQLNHQFMPIKWELALWRAFLGDEIDAILRDEE
jgi:hypothetical protein